MRNTPLISGFFANGTTVINQIDFTATEKINGLTIYSIDVPENATTLGLSGNSSYAYDIQVYAV